MLIARVAEEIVGRRGTLCGRKIRDAHNRLVGDDFTAPEARLSVGGRSYPCCCRCGNVVVREGIRPCLQFGRAWMRQP